ncbi:MAG TPA: GNAT family N-acetyltransferase [Ktedonobacteraceae bacterium]|nr:GNAT family N-acetyltransferase [Ktedonobacteraceae bacterium]
MVVERMEMITLESLRLQIRTVMADDLAGVFQVLRSDPDFLRYREGSQGEPGCFDLQAWERDWQVAQMMPGRHALGCVLKATGEFVGYVDYLEEHEDGFPWLGALTIDMAHRHKGFGREAFECLVGHFREHVGCGCARVSWG